LCNEQFHGIKSAISPENTRRAYAFAWALVLLTTDICSGSITRYNRSRAERKTTRKTDVYKSKHFYMVLIGEDGNVVRDTLRKREEEGGFTLGKSSFVVLNCLHATLIFQIERTIDDVRLLFEKWSDLYVSDIKYAPPCREKCY
jgi:hypothetical protein